MTWTKLFPGNPEGGVEGSLPFRFENFGTFAGPQNSSTNYDYDKMSIEGTWTESVPGDYAFKNVDLGAYLYNNETNYVDSIVMEFQQHKCIFNTVLATFQSLMFLLM